MAAIPTFVVHPPSPSPFASLLRRSKFASYDPTIGQVYTTHDGNAHRGNWGFKRPLALRKRDKFISVEAVDSPEQQTEWTSRESEARFIERWEKVATEPNIRDAWDRHYMNSRPVHQAELAKEDAGGNIVGPATQRQLDESLDARRYVASGPLISAMSTRQFSRYLDKLRRQRPQFLEFLSHEAGRTTKSQIAPWSQVAPSAYEESTLGSAETVRRRFLQKQSHTTYETPDSRAIEQRPHRNAGLSYAYASQLTHFFATTEQPGRWLDSQGSDRYRTAQASFAGMAVTIKSPINDSEAGPKLRIVESVLRQAPSVVHARPQGLHGAIIEATAADVTHLEMLRANPFPPGSRAYIAHTQTIVRPKGKRLLTAPKPKSPYEVDAETANVSQQLLDSLRTLIKAMPSGGDKEAS
ncbi:mitochondrial ribosomal protein subunit-domain-containing protein [Russula earlei]|uniref:Mitochondrial ribosomal protein subunit-domain-containing protein n=1 Tax=Russula earlei TaxID=71964 RepID=A0ACC0UEX6_9AGAM|nr:mitochondrial ribosomal protein subunit-domain-containing protein [Russula earlei]